MLHKSFLLLLMTLPLVCIAQVYKHVDEHGNVTFTDKPPADSELIEVRAPNTLAAPPKIEYATESRKEPEVASESYTLAITAPANETVIPNGPGNFSVTASVTPGLQGGSRLQLLIDGEPRGEPQKGTSWALTNVYRGAHQLVVVALDSKDKEVGKSDPVTVYVFRPSINR
jgi:hypothetical protein